LSATVQELRASETNIHNLSAFLADKASTDSLYARMRSRGEDALSGMRANLALTKAHMKSVELLTGTTTRELNFLDRLSNCGAAWPVDVMLQYFHQDWTPTDDFDRVKRTIVSALTRHGQNAGPIAVLGAGACGMVHAVSTEFERVCGIDLCVPMLLIARDVMRGNSITVHVERADWRAIELRRRQAATDNIQLAVADASSLPFPDNSLAAVVTQFLLDIVGNPARVASEIRRTLRPGGVWVNFSPPMKAPFPQLGGLAPEELSTFLEIAGFDVLESRYERSACVDLGTLSDTAPNILFLVQFFTARKTSNPVGIHAGQGRNVLASDDEAWWQGVPAVVVGRNIKIASVENFAANRQSRSAEMAFGFIYGVAPPSVLEEQDTAQLKTVLVLMDGKRTFTEIFLHVAKQANTISRSDFRELVHHLSDRLGLLEVASSVPV